LARLRFNGEAAVCSCGDGEDGVSKQKTHRFRWGVDEERLSLIAATFTVANLPENMLCRKWKRRR
jgi:hypothetical protein